MRGERTANVRWLSGEHRVTPSGDGPEPDRATDPPTTLHRSDGEGGRMRGVEWARVDRWLWSIRLYRTRTDATAACRAGHVAVNGAGAKPATRVRAGDRVEARTHGRDRVFEVVEPLERRVGAARAAECALDHSPPAAARLEEVFAREPGAGRPTKRERRQLDRLRS